MESLIPSELILTPEGRIYHLRLKKGEVATNIILVGDPERVPVVSSMFDRVELKVSNREINTHTGFVGNVPVSVLSTGMGPDNIDIVMNELDALFNVDFETGLPVDKKTRLNIVRIGTSGALQPDIPVDSFVISTHGVGLDGLVYFYKDPERIIDKELTRAFLEQTSWPEKLARPYIVEGSPDLIRKLGKGMIEGLTVTAPGFYGPQGRSLRIQLSDPGSNKRLSNFRFNDHRLINYEMETAALYGLGRFMDHNTATTCLILANRMTGEYSSNYGKMITDLIATILEQLTG
jgi:uridine phosphorylase